MAASIRYVQHSCIFRDPLVIRSTSALIRVAAADLESEEELTYMVWL